MATLPVSVVEPRNSDDGSQLTFLYEIESCTVTTSPRFAVLASAAVPFTSTHPALFASPSGEVTVDMMGGASGAARTANGWQSVELPYRDGTLVAVAVLPP